MKEVINKTVESLNRGEIIIYPTDTIWGIGCDATNNDAVARIYEIKKRPEIKSMLILVDTMEMLKKYVKKVPDIAYQIIETIDNPLTIIYPDAINLAPNLIAPDGSIGIRIVKDDFCRQIIEILKKPIVSTSANIGGSRSPLGFFDIEEEVKKAVDYIVPLYHEKLSTRKSSDIIRIKKTGDIEVIR